MSMTLCQNFNKVCKEIVIVSLMKAWFSWTLKSDSVELNFEIRIKDVSAFKVCYRFFIMKIENEIMKN